MIIFCAALDLLFSSISLDFSTCQPSGGRVGNWFCFPMSRVRNLLWLSTAKPHLGFPIPEPCSLGHLSNCLDSKTLHAFHDLFWIQIQFYAGPLFNLTASTFNCWQVSASWLMTFWGRTLLGAEWVVHREKSPLSIVLLLKLLLTCFKHA